MKNLWGPVRALVVAAAGAGLVLGAGRYPGTVELRTPTERQALPAPKAAVLTDARLVCPGPEPVGIDLVRSVSGTTALTAVTPPAVAMPPGIPSQTAGGTLTMGGLGGSTLATTPVAPSRQRPALSTVTLPAAIADNPLGVIVAGTGDGAPGLAGLQTWTRLDGDDRGFAAAACQRPTSDMWLLGGGGEASRRERLIIANPGAAPIEVSVAVLGAKGPISPDHPTVVAVPPESRTAVLVDALAPNESAPAVHLTTPVGEFTAWLNDAWIEGATPRGTDDAGPSAPPATRLVIPGIDLTTTAGVTARAVLRLAAVGEGAVVQLSTITEAGSAPLAKNAVVMVPASGTIDVDLSFLDAGSYAVRVDSDRPVVAGAYVERRRATSEPVSDFGWAPAAVALIGVAGSSVPAGTRATLHLVATTDAVLTVTTMDAGGRIVTRDVPVAAQRSVAETVDNTSAPGPAAVWVTAVKGEARASVVLSRDEPDGPLVSVIALREAAVTRTELPLREVR